MEYPACHPDAPLLRQVTMNGSPLEPFLDSTLPYVAYNAARALGDPRTAVFKARLYADSRINSIIAELNDWPGTVLSSHKSARQCFHKLALLADLGVEACVEPDSSSKVKSGFYRNARRRIRMRASWRRFYPRFSLPGVQGLGFWPEEGAIGMVAAQGRNNPRSSLKRVQCTSSNTS